MRAEFTMPLNQFVVRGFSLIEVLIALFVLSLGLIGLAALQTTAFKFNHQSHERTQAIIQAYDILDRIRANPIGKNAGLYDAVALGYTVSGYRDCMALTCTATQMAEYDISEWNTVNASLLAEGAGQIATNASTSIRTITIQWREADLTTALIVEAQL